MPECDCPGQGREDNEQRKAKDHALGVGGESHEFIMAGAEGIKRSLILLIVDLYEKLPATAATSCSSVHFLVSLIFMNSNCRNDITLL